MTLSDRSGSPPHDPRPPHTPLVARLCRCGYVATRKRALAMARSVSAFGRAADSPHLDFPDGSVGGVSSASSSTPVAASTTSPARWTVARWPRARSTVSYRSTGSGPTSVGYSSTVVSDQATSTGTGASAGSVRATSRTLDDPSA